MRIPIKRMSDALASGTPPRRPENQFEVRLQCHYWAMARKYLACAWRHRPNKHADGLCSTVRRCSLYRTLHEKAQQNIISVQEARYDHTRVTPHLQEIVSALRLRSIAVGNLAGAEPAMLQLDITRGSRWTTMPSRPNWRPLSRTASTSTQMARVWSSARKKTRAPG